MGGPAGPPASVGSGPPSAPLPALRFAPHADSCARAPRGHGWFRSHWRERPAAARARRRDASCSLDDVGAAGSAPRVPPGRRRRTDVTTAEAHTFGWSRSAVVAQVADDYRVAGSNPAGTAMAERP